MKQLWFVVWKHHIFLDAKGDSLQFNLVWINSDSTFYITDVYQWWHLQQNNNGNIQYCVTSLEIKRIWQYAVENKCPHGGDTGYKSLKRQAQRLLSFHNLTLQWQGQNPEATLVCSNTSLHLPDTTKESWCEDLLCRRKEQKQSFMRNVYSLS